MRRALLDGRIAACTGMDADPPHRESIHDGSDLDRNLHCHDWKLFLVSSSMILPGAGGFSIRGFLKFFEFGGLRAPAPGEQGSSG